MKFTVEYAKSGYSTCQGCKSKEIANNKIAKGTLRIGSICQADQYDGFYEAWHHIDCFFDSRAETPYCLDDIGGIQRIRHDDQLLIIKKINETETDLIVPTKRFKLDNVNELNSNVTPIIALQNELYYKIYAAMSEKNPFVQERQKKKMLIEILDLNKQTKPLIKRASTEVFLAHVVDIIAFGAMEACSQCSNPGYIFDGTYGYVCNSRFYGHGGVRCNNRKMAPQRFECIIPDYIKDMYPILHEPRVPTIRMLYNLIPPENPNVGAALNATLSADSDQVTPPTKVASGKQILKYGTVVDSLSGIEKEAHVYSPEGGVEYAVILSKTNIQDNKNSFYKLQLLESDDYKKYWFFTHYGRIGVSGSNKLMQCTSLQEALDSFNDKYMSLTGETFGFEFFDIPFKYKRVDMNYSDEVDIAKLLVNNDLPSKLPDSVQQLVKLCFDIHNMRDMMIELELDLDKIPLGKLSKDQIDKGYDILAEVLDAVVRGASEIEFIHMTNRFYTLIPHDFGPDPPPVINDLCRMNEKLEMLVNLADIQLAYSLLSTDNDINKSAVDNCHDKLKTDFEPLDRSSQLFMFLEQYVNRTHAPTHNFQLEIEDIFKITRHGEATRYEPFQNSENRYLLWHGSRITNFVGILKNGLKIAPPQAERTGDMFGNGIYFSDVVTKSAQYCRVDRNDRHGLLLLCEVALGEIDNYLEGFTSPCPILNGKSVKGCGQTFPDPNKNVVRDGVTVPCGNLMTDHRIQSQLQYNEYVVYDECKVNIKYLFKVKFQRKRN